MTQKPDRRVDFEKLNLVGKTLFVGGALFRALAKGLDTAIDKTSSLVVDVERSFRDGLDDNIEDAKILEERPKKKSRPN